MTLTLHLIGVVRLVDLDGTDLTPRSQKARGALALLGTAQGMQMNRSRLQDYLWSERDQEQGSASLRQMLRELRRSLRHYRDALTSGPGWIGLDRRIIAVDLTPCRDIAGHAQEFASDLEIDDPEFEDWLRDTRNRFYPDDDLEPAALPAPDLITDAAAPVGLIPASPASQTTEKPQPVSLVVIASLSSEDPDHVIGAILMHEAAWRASEILLLPVVTISPDSRDQGPLRRLDIRAAATRQGGRVAVLVTVLEGGIGRLMAHRRFDLGESADVATISNAAARLSVDLIDCVDRMIQQEALRDFVAADVFSFSKQRLEIAEKGILDLETDTREQLAVKMALRSFLGFTRVIERIVPNPDDTLAEAAELSVRARELAPQNANVLGICALLAAFQGNDSAGWELSRKSLSLDSGSDFGRLAKVQTLLDHNRPGEALEHVQDMEGGIMASLAPATWLTRRGLAELRLGRFSDAERSVEAAQAFSPDARPALRVLAALRHARADYAGAQEAVNRLRQLEPGFSTTLFADPGYPAGSLRSVGLLGIAKADY